MNLGLRDRVAIVCAASQGLGKATALGFAREGAIVVICSRDRSRLEYAMEEISSEVPGARILAVPTDVSVPEQITALVEKAQRECGRIDILVTNAGGPPSGAFMELDDTQWERGVALNLMSTIRMIRAVVPHMKERRWGRIVNITSLAAKQPIGDLIISSTVRPGILGLSKVLSQQLGRDGILINSVAPGYFLTARQKELSQARAAAKGVSLEAYLAESTRDTPVGRVGDPDELANVIVFLCSDRASYVTGSVVTVDGGLTRGLF